MNYSFMLAKEYSENMKLPKELQGNNPPPIGWYLSEKYDGYRSRWVHDENKFLSRAQKEFNAPEWFKEAMSPNHDLDGELWVGRKNFQYMGVVRKKNPNPEEWANIKYVVYDLPEYEGDFKTRIATLKKIVKINHNRWELNRGFRPEHFRNLECPLIMADQIIVKNMTQFKNHYEKIVAEGGEGVMIKYPCSLYEDKRSNYLLKYKPNFDAEAIIIDYSEGKGKYRGMLGGFVCKQLINHDSFHAIDNDENHEFCISGMDDEVRMNYKLTHPVGTIISYEHSGKTGSGKPRFARYIRIRDDITIKDMPNTSENSIKKRNRIISIFGKLYAYEKSIGEKFKANSYGKSINSLKMVEDDSELTEENLIKMNGIGKSLLSKILEIIKTDTCPMYENVKDFNDPNKVFEDIHAVGEIAAKKLVSKGFKTIEDLRNCSNIEEHLNNKQLIGLKFYEDILARIPREEIVEHEKLLKKVLNSIDTTSELIIAGSYRRGKSESGDIDVLLKSKDKKTYPKLIDTLTKIGYLYPEHLAKGQKKFNGLGKIKENLPYRRIDIMYTTHSEYPVALLYFTGSKDFNTQMRGKILERGMTLNEYSLKDCDTMEVMDHKFKEEKDIFEYLDMEYVEPTMR